MAIAKDNTFDFVDSNSFWIDKDEKAMACIDKLPVQDKIIYQYNQHIQAPVDTRYMCTVFASAICVSSLFNQKRTREQLEAACLVGVTKYRMKLTGGNATQTGAKTVAVYNNEVMDKQAAFFVANLFDEWCEKALDKWLLGVVTLRWYPSGTVWFFAQMLQGVIKGGKDMRSKTGHAIAIGRGKDGWYRFYDSDSRGTQAECSKEMMKDLIKQWVFYPVIRIWLPLEDITTLTPQAYTAVQTAIKGNSDARQYADDNWKKLLNDANNYLRSLL